MKMIIVVALALAAVAVAAPAEPIKILRSDFEQQPGGDFVYGIETENGIQSQVTGEVKEVLDEDNKPQQVVIIRGSYSYTDPEGNPVSISYVADEGGFHPLGDRIPTAPPVRR